MDCKRRLVDGGYCGWYEDPGLLDVQEPPFAKRAAVMAHIHRACEELEISLRDIRILFIGFNTQWVKEMVDLSECESMTHVKLLFPAYFIPVATQLPGCLVEVLLPPALAHIALGAISAFFANGKCNRKWHVRFLNHSLANLTHMTIADPDISVSAVALPTQLQQATRDDGGDNGDKQQPFLLFDGKFAADEHGYTVYQYDFAEFYLLFNGLIDSRYIVEMIRQYLIFFANEE